MYIVCKCEVRLEEHTTGLSDEWDFEKNLTTFFLSLAGDK